MLKLSNYEGNPYIGVYSTANESIALLPSDSGAELAKAVEGAMDVEPVRLTMSSSHVIGSLVAMNSHGIVVTNQAESAEIRRLEEYLPVFKINDRLNAAGNNILVNDHGLVVNRNMKPKTIEDLEDFFGLECLRLRVAGMDTVGSACKVTNKGGICHPKATAVEMAELSQALKVDFTPITLNYGSAMVGSCVIANSKGAVVGNISTPIELGKLEDSLYLY